MVGEEPVRKISQRKNKAGTLLLLPSTECVMDRLFAYFHFGDPHFNTIVFSANPNRYFETIGVDGVVAPI